jgi:copper chaperone NosL
MSTRLHISTRIMLFVAAAALIIMLFVPLWRIELNAPQYPEGLRLLINTNGLGGDVEIVNGLNHYIGMKTLHNEDFIEFTVLPYIIVFFAFASILVSIVNRRKWLNVLFFSFVVFGLIAFADFWRWEYDYGHNLDPNAAIVVPGMAYQPPLIGFKQLLNFGAYSIPDKGGWLFIGVGVILLTLTLMEWKLYKRNKLLPRPQLAMILLLTATIAGCNEISPDPIKTGTDQCYSCKMTISDPRFGAVLITNKGKQLKFDDITCLRSFIQSKSMEGIADADIYFVDFSDKHLLHHSNSVYLMKSETLKGPMNGDILAFSNRDSFTKALGDFKGVETKWEALLK